MNFAAKSTLAVMFHHVIRFYHGITVPCRRSCVVILFNPARYILQRALEARSTGGKEEERCVCCSLPLIYSLLYGVQGSASLAALVEGFRQRQDEGKELQEQQQKKREQTVHRALEAKMERIDKVYSS